MRHKEKCPILKRVSSDYKYTRLPKACSDFRWKSIEILKNAEYLGLKLLICQKNSQMWQIGVLRMFVLVLG